MGGRAHHQLSEAEQCGRQQPLRLEVARGRGGAQKSDALGPLLGIEAVQINADHPTAPIDDSGNGGNVVRDADVAKEVGGWPGLLLEEPGLAHVQGDEPGVLGHAGRDEQRAPGALAVLLEVQQRPAPLVLPLRLDDGVGQIALHTPLVRCHVVVENERIVRISLAYLIDPSLVVDHGDVRGEVVHEAPVDHVDLGGEQQYPGVLHVSQRTRLDEQVQFRRHLAERATDNGARVEKLGHRLADHAARRPGPLVAGVDAPAVEDRCLFDTSQAKRGVAQAEQVEQVARVRPVQGRERRAGAFEVSLEHVEGGEVVGKGLLVAVVPVEGQGLQEVGLGVERVVPAPGQEQGDVSVLLVAVGAPRQRLAQGRELVPFRTRRAAARRCRAGHGAAPPNAGPGVPLVHPIGIPDPIRSRFPFPRQACGEPWRQWRRVSSGKMRRRCLRIGKCR